MAWKKDTDHQNFDPTLQHLPHPNFHFYSFCVRDSIFLSFWIALEKLRRKSSIRLFRILPWKKDTATRSFLKISKISFFRFLLVVELDGQTRSYWIAHRKLRTNLSDEVFRMLACKKDTDHQNFVPTLQHPPHPNFHFYSSCVGASIFVALDSPWKTKSKVVWSSFPYIALEKRYGHSKFFKNFKNFIFSIFVRSQARRPNAVLLDSPSKTKNKWLWWGFSYDGLKKRYGPSKFRPDITTPTTPKFPFLLILRPWLDFCRFG